MKITRNFRRRIYKCYKSSNTKILILALVLLLLWHNNRDKISDLVRRNRHWYIPDVEFFKPTLYLKPQLSKQSGIKFFNDPREVVSNFRLNGFKYCRNLDNSWFNGNVFIQKLNGTVLGINPSRGIVVDIIDDVARKITEFLNDRNSLGVQDDVVRLACYLAAQGNNQMANLTDSEFLYNIHPETYFKDQLPAILSNKTENPKIHKKFKIAYYILIEDYNTLRQLENLLNIVNDGHGFILIQIDKRIYKDIQPRLESLIKPSRHHNNIIIAKTLYLHVDGHISRLFSLLNGYYELMDAAVWDYVINLSVFDWPLESNKEIYTILEEYGKQKSWISLWRDSKWVSHRLLRPHFAILSEDKYSNFHSEDFGISYWPMTNWRLFRNSPWTILSRSAVSFLRSDGSCFRYLAFLEHSYEPEEIFIATALMNSPVIQGSVNMESFRYLRESHKWIGYGDRHLFPLDQKTRPYLFMRPFNSSSKQNEEDKLIRWMRKKNDGVDICQQQQFIDDNCFKAFVDRISFDDNIILVPISMQNYSSLAKNLECSLNRIGYTNVILWTFDQKAHDEVSKLGLNSFYDPLPTNILNLHLDSTFQRAKSEHKLSILQKLIKNGYNVLYLDPDTIVLQDMFTKILRYTHNPFNADVMVGSNEGAMMNKDSEAFRISAVDSDIVYFRKTAGAISLLDRIKKYMEENQNSTFENAFNFLIHQETIQITGFGASPHDPIYPSENNPVEQQKDTRFGSDLTNLFQLGFSTPAEDHNEISRIHILDQEEFVNGKIYFDNDFKMGSKEESVMLIHASNQKNVEKVFKTYKFWYLDSYDVCIRT